MKSTYEPYKQSPVYKISFELENNETEILKVYENGFIFELPRGEGWVILSNTGYHWALFKNDTIVPAGIFVEDKWNGFLYPNGVEKVENALEILDNFILEVEEKIKATEIN